MGENDDNNGTTGDNDHNNDGEDSKDRPTQHPPPLLRATARGGKAGASDGEGA